MKFSVLRYNFFVENIALNAANATLKYGDLTQKVNDLAIKREDVNETQFQQFDDPIEMSPNTYLGKAYAEYKKIRGR